MNKKYINYLLVILIAIIAFFAGKYSSQDESQESKALSHTVETIGNTSVQTTQDEVENTGEVPEKVYKVLRYIRENNEAPSGYVGGRTFHNRENQLPKKNSDGSKIKYQEWDVNPKIEGKNRGAERLVTSPSKAYYTNNHYKSFIEIQE